MWKGLRYQRSDGPASVKVAIAIGILCYVISLPFLVMLPGSVPLREDHPLKEAE